MLTIAGYLLLLSLASIGHTLVAGVDYNKLVQWERRTLYCEQSADELSSGPCYLTVREDSKPEAALCHRQVVHSQSGDEEVRFSCDIQCENADRDSVISKYPNSNRECIRFFTYNTDFDERSKKWSIWRKGECAMNEISLEVHCGFPSDN